MTADLRRRNGRGGTGKEMLALQLGHQGGGFLQGKMTDSCFLVHKRNHLWFAVFCCLLSESRTRDFSKP